MRPRDLLATNLRALMAVHPALNTLPKITAASGVSNGTLDRARRAAVAIRIDELESLAGAFGLEAWQLLLPDLDPKQPQTVHRPTEQEAALYRRIQRELERLGEMRGMASTRPSSLDDSD